MTISIFKWCSFAILAATTSACAFGTDGEPTGEPVATAEEALFQSSTAYTWYQGQASKQMTSVTNSMCFLNHVQGQFNGSNEKVWIEAASPGIWLLMGTSSSSGLGAWSYCITGLSPSQIDTGPELTWTQGDDPRNLGSAEGGRACFLTRMEGRFRAASEHVQVWKSGSFWYLGGSSSQTGVKAGARCVTGVSPATSGTWQHPNPTLHMGQSYNNTRACAIRAISGNFGNPGTYVQVKPEWNASQGQDYWYFRGIAAATPKVLSVTGGCIF